MTTNTDYAIAQRRHRDPPTLWVSLISSSVVVHGLLLLVLLPLSVRLNPTPQSSLSAVPIDLVELEPAPSATDVIPPPDVASVTPAPDSAPPNPIAPAPDPVSSSVPTPVATPFPRAIASPETPRPIAPPEPIPPSIPAPPAPTTPESSAPVTPAADATPSPTLPPPPSVSAPGTPNPLPAPDAVGEPAMPEVGINTETAPTNLVANIVGVDSIPVDEAYDTPQVLPSPVSTIQRFTPDPTLSDPFNPNACALDPDSQRDLGQEVALQLVVQSDGQVVDAIAREQGTNLNPAYVELATCLVKTWQFNPAYNVTENGNEAVFSDHLVVRIVINPG